MRAPDTHRIQIWCYCSTQAVCLGLYCVPGSIAHTLVQSACLDIAGAVANVAVGISMPTDGRSFS
jgi:hypothetical protein